MSNPNKVFDGLLVMQYRSGNKKALELLVKRYHRKLCNQSNWYVRDVDMAQDIVQDSWSIILDKLSSLKDVNTFECWAMRIVTRKSFDHLKQEKRKREKLKTYVSPDSEGLYDEKENEIKKLNKAIGELSKNQQIVLRLFYIEEYSMNEISEILEIPVGTIKSRLFHAREKLKTTLK